MSTLKVNQIEPYAGGTLTIVSASFPGASVASASYAGNATSASYALTASFSLNVPSFNTSSLLITASAAGNVVTFTKGDGSTFPVTVATGSGGGGISTPIVIPRTTGTASVSGFTGSLYTMDCASGSNFVINLNTSSLSILNPINITAGQEISLTVNQTSSITGIDLSLSNLQFNTNINVPTSLTRYLMTVSSSAIDVVRFTAQNTSSLEAYGYYQNLNQRAISTNPFITATGGTVTTDGNYRIQQLVFRKQRVLQMNKDRRFTCQKCKLEINLNEPRTAHRVNGEFTGWNHLGCK